MNNKSWSSSHETSGSGHFPSEFQEFSTRISNGTDIVSADNTWELQRMDTRAWYDRSYADHGFGAQRRYPNEELLRFFGRHYFPMDAKRRRDTRVLEVGCGSGANLWMIAREGFEAHGIDLSPVGIDLCRQMLKHWQTEATLQSGNMLDIPYADQHFDVVVDVFASYCLNENDFIRYLCEVFRVLKPSGRIFLYTPSKASDAFRDPGPSRRIDGSTVDGIRRETAPFFNNDFAFRFTTRDECARAFSDNGFAVTYNEEVGRTYRGGLEYFELVVVVGERLENGAASAR
jgi:SAM-dependent methyltransferase